MNLRRSLPALGFIAVLAVHMAWLSRPALKGCVEDSQGKSVPMASEEPLVLCPSAMGFSQYLEEQNYYISFSYALAAAFTIFALGRWRSARAGAVAGAATGVSLVALVAGFGCFVVGCCGSPMLPVWIALFGARGVGLAKPIVAGLTVLSLGVGYLLMRRGCGPACGCHAPATKENVQVTPVSVKVAMADCGAPSPQSAEAFAEVSKVVGRFKDLAEARAVSRSDPMLEDLGLTVEPTVLIDDLVVSVGKAPDSGYLVRAIKHALSLRCDCADGECCS